MAMVIRYFSCSAYTQNIPDRQRRQRLCPRPTLDASAKVGYRTALDQPPRQQNYLAETISMLIDQMVENTLHVSDAEAELHQPRNAMAHHAVCFYRRRNRRIDLGNPSTPRIWPI